MAGGRSGRCRYLRPIPPRAWRGTELHGASGMIVETTIHSFSLWHHFAHKPDFDAIAFAELARSMGFQGISLSLNNRKLPSSGWA